MKRTARRVVTVLAAGVIRIIALFRALHNTVAAVLRAVARGAGGPPGVASACERRADAVTMSARHQCISKKTKRNETKRERPGVGPLPSQTRKRSIPAVHAVAGGVCLHLEGGARHGATSAIHGSANKLLVG